MKGAGANHRLGEAALRRGGVATAWALLFTSSGCVQLSDGFACQTSTQCLSAGQTGTCETNQRCSFPIDDGCASKKRYRNAGSLTGQCVVILVDAGSIGMGGGMDGPALAPDVDAGVLSFAASHLGASRDLGTAALSPSSRIDTDALTIDGAPPPHGATFVLDAATNQAVLTVGSFTVAPSATVRVVGGRGLTILAASIVVGGALDLSAQGATPGPGGFATGPGDGAPGVLGIGGWTSGGGGGSFVALGAPGGGNNGGSQILSGGNPGPSYGDPVLPTLFGGSGGGKGGCASPPSGGAGGGVVQLTAADHIYVPGQVNVGGGGGSSSGTCGGSGGGSAGAIFIESLSVVVNGFLSANGGGGGAGSGQGAGANGGQACPTPGGGSSLGGGGGCLQPAGPGRSYNSSIPGGASGGGGAAGVIVIRSRGDASLGGIVSPLPELDPML